MNHRYLQCDANQIPRGRNDMNNKQNKIYNLTDINYLKKKKDKDLYV